MKKSISSVWFCLLVFISVSCNQDDEETAMVPRVEASMERTFNFLESKEEDKVNYSLISSEMLLLLDDDKLELRFAPTRPTGKDAVVFKVKKSELANGLIGTYQIRSLGNAKSGNADLTYYHYYNKTGSTALFSSGNSMEGNVEIKTYSASTGLASGSFSVTIKNVKDPASNEVNAAQSRKCDIIVKGDFNNLKLTK